MSLVNREGKTLSFLSLKGRDLSMIVVMGQEPYRDLSIDKLPILKTKNTFKKQVLGPAKWRIG